MYVEVETIEVQVRDRICKRLASLGDNPRESMRQNVKQGVNTVIKKSQQRLNQVLQERQKLLYLATKGRFSEAEIEGETNRLLHEENVARADLARANMIEQSHQPLLEEAVVDIEAIQNWGALPIDQLRLVLQRLIQAVNVDEDWQVVHIEWQPLWEMLWFGPHTTG